MRRPSTSGTAAGGPPGETPVQFELAGEPVYGILHRPARSEGARSRIGVLFINAGARSRRGPNLLYVRLARRLCEAGYPVLRYDPPGIGDSPGDVPAAVYRRRFFDCSDSSELAIDLLRRETGVERIAMFGLCGGGHSAVTACGAHGGIDLLILASLPVQDLGDITEESVAGITTHAYLYRALRWSSWYKFFSGKSNYRFMMRWLTGLVRGHYRPPGIDHKLWGSLRDFFAAGGRSLIVFGTRDILYPPFARLSRKHMRGPEFRDCRIQLVEGADHTFARLGAQEELMSATLDWLNEMAETVRPAA